MKAILLVSALLMLAACESEAPPAPKTAPTVDIPNSKEITKEVNKGVKDVLANKGPKWKIDYSGDLQGSIEGSIMTAMSVASSTVAHGAGMSEDMKGKAKATFTARITTAGESPSATMSLTLGDGTKCSQAYGGDVAPTEVKLIDPDAKTFKAELSGALKCGEGKDKHITYKAMLNKNP